MKSGKLSLIVSLIALLGSNLAISTSIARAKDIPSKITTNQSHFLKGWQRTKAPSLDGFGARRGSCEMLSGEILPILPGETDSNGKIVYTKSVWNTASDYPQIHVYMPEATPEAKNSEFSYEAEFVLKADTGTKDTQGNAIYEDVYVAEIQLPQKSGVVTLDFKDAAQFPALELNKSYQWDLEVLCDPNDRSGNPVVSGWIQRVDAGELESKLEETEARQRPQIYESASIWYESVSSLAALMIQNPSDPLLKQQWVTLMGEVGHPELAQVPLAGSATIISENN
jgi:hypothetical protein